MAFEALATSTAMPVAAQQLDGLREYGLAFSIFLTLYLFGVVLAGSWGDASGPAGPVTAGLTFFGAGLLISGFAQHFTVLLLGRAVAGVGGGLLVVSMYLVVAAVFPEQDQPRVFSYVSAAWVVPSVVGPALAGWLAEQVSWRLVFLAVPPLLVVLAVILVPLVRPLSAGARRAPDQRPGHDRWRVLRGGALAVAAAGLQGGLHLVGRDGGSSRVGGVLVLAVSLAAVLALLPGLLPPGALRLARGLPTVVVLRGMYAAAFFGAEAFVPLMLVRERGLSPSMAGLALTGGAIGWAVGSWLQSRPWLAVPRYLFLAVGGLLVGLGIAVMIVLTWPGVPTVAAVGVWAVAGAGMGLAMASTSVLVLRLSPEGTEGRNSASLQISDALGSVIGIGCAGALFAALHQEQGSDADVFRLMWAALAVLGFLSVAVAFRARTGVTVPRGVP